MRVRGRHQQEQHLLSMVDCEVDRGNNDNERIGIEDLAFSKDMCLVRL